ncbi:SDR family NAD(P)-dependent oxidoreductase [Paenibacillus koleovorans]
MGHEGSAGYCAAKGAITTLTKALAADEARYGVRVNGLWMHDRYIAC